MQPNQSIPCDNANVVGNINDMIVNFEEDNEDLKNNTTNTRKGLEGWDPWRSEFEEAVKVPLFEGSTLSNLCETLLIVNCCHTHGTSNAFIIEILGLLKKNILSNPNTLPSFEYEASSTIDALSSPGVNPLEGSPKCSCGKLGVGRRSWLPTLERSRGSSWEPRD
jgi:hypothetical protein